MAVSAAAIRSIIAAEAGIDEGRLKPEATLAELDIGSIDVASALFALEEQFGIEIEPDNIMPDSTISQFVEYVLSLSDR